jgi:hypothetical protein
MKRFLRWIGLKEKLHEAEHHSRMRVAPDGSRCLDGTRLSSQLSKLPSKKVVIVDAPRGSASSSIEESWLISVSMATSGDVRDQPKVADAAWELLQDVSEKTGVLAAWCMASQAFRSAPRSSWKSFSR